MKFINMNLSLNKKYLNLSAQRENEGDIQLYQSKRERERKIGAKIMFLKIKNKPEKDSLYKEKNT